MSKPIHFGEPNIKMVEQIKRLNDDIFRPDRKNLNLLAYYGTDILCGAILCRYESEDEPGVYSVYLTNIAVLEPYRRLGIASMLLNKMIENLENLGNVHKLKLHVWSPNEAGIQFYKKHGFATESLVEDYYTNLEPRSAWLLYKDIVPKEKGSK